MKRKKVKKGREKMRTEAQRIGKIKAKERRDKIRDREKRWEVNAEIVNKKRRKARKEWKLIKKKRVGEMHGRKKGKIKNI